MSDYRDSSPPENSGLMTAAALMAITGWVGLWILLTSMLPTAAPLWFFFVLLYLAVTGTVLPFVRFLNMRFAREDRSPSDGVILRQSIWVGLFVVACAWLQIPRVLNPVIAFFLGLSLIAVEGFLHIREQDTE